MVNFVVSDADPTGTSLQDFYETSFFKLQKLFGDPKGWDDYKTSTQWVFKGDTGIIITLYDYKMTHLYDPSYPSVTAFRARTNYAWHVGAKTSKDAEVFIQWLEKELNK